VRFPAWTAWLAGATLVACASAPPAAPAHGLEEHEEHDAAVEEASPAASTTVVDAPERSRAPSTATYEEALSTAEALDVNDERVHLTDAQLTGPIRGVVSTCRVPSNARVTIKTAVQYGRAIGVTVDVRFERPKSAKKPPSKAVLKAEAKTAKKIISCADHAVRAVVWPPSRRRDSFTTEF
jgi:hypothetical protein